VRFISDFEDTATRIGISNGYHFVICGHIHQPVIREFTNDEGSIIYLNSGDWIENLTSLEYSNGAWTLYRFEEDDLLHTDPAESESLTSMSSKEIFLALTKEFNLRRA